MRYSDKAILSTLKPAPAILLDAPDRISERGSFGKTYCSTPSLSLRRKSPGLERPGRRCTQSRFSERGKQRGSGKHRCSSWSLILKARGGGLVNKVRTLLILQWDPEATQARRGSHTPYLSTNAGKVKKTLTPAADPILLVSPQPIVEIHTLSHHNY